MNTALFFDSLVRDTRHGLRALRKNPGFTVVALLTLALGIGANTAVFGYPKPEQLVALRQIAPGAAGLASFNDGLPLSLSMYVTYSEHNQSFQNMGVWVTTTANITGLAEPEQVRTIVVSNGVLEALGVPPAAGRWLSAADQIPRGPERVMLSYGYWERRFGGARSAVGSTITANSHPREIVGVMPRGFRVLNADFDLLAPIQFDRGQLILAGFGLNGIGRLKPGVSIARANADLARLLPVWMDSWTNGPGTGNGRHYTNWRITPAVRSLKQGWSARSTTSCGW
jgi:hypothetical protein